jgi:hypothetical protein
VWPLCLTVTSACIGAVACMVPLAFDRLFFFSHNSCVVHDSMRRMMKTHAVAAFGVRSSRCHTRAACMHAAMQGV